MHSTATLRKLASTKCGMRKILKQQLSPVDYIRKAVQTGVYKGIYYDEDGNEKNNNHRNNKHQRRPQNNTGPMAHFYMPKVNPYPDEYEILSLNPPLPEEFKLSKKDLKLLQEEEIAKQEKMKQKRKGSTSTYTSTNNDLNRLPTNRLIRNYMKRHDDRMKATSTLSDSEKEDEYYNRILGLAGNSASSSSTTFSSTPRIEDMNTAMGRKPAVLNHAYEFALKQYQVLSENENMSEKDSIQLVEELLAKEEKDERIQSRINAQQIVKDIAKKKEASKDTATNTTTTNNNNNNNNAISTHTNTPPSATIPSILYSKPRTIQALHIWGKRLQAVPYNQWTLGASTALDHWIAVDVLGMKEETWNRLLNGDLESDIQEGSGNDDLIIGDGARMNDIVTVRSTLFPETILHALEDEEEIMAIEEEFGNAEDALNNLDDNEGLDEKKATERSIDELLASLGGFEEEEKEEEEKEEEEEDMDKRVTTMVDTLQDWRAKNIEKPFDEWDDIVKDQFNNWLSKYLALVTNETDGEVDINATREALLAEPPLYRETANQFWSQVHDEADAEMLLDKLRGEESTSNENETEVDKKSREALEVFLSLPYDKQVHQLVTLGTLRPILDEYYKESDRLKFMEKYSETLLEGMEIEHLVSDPNGLITAQDIGPGFFNKNEKIDPNSRFSIEKIPYGTNDFGMTRSERARMLYRAWNTHKAGRARYAESQFKKGKMPLKEVVSKKKY